MEAYGVPVDTPQILERSLIDVQVAIPTHIFSEGRPNRTLSSVPEWGISDIMSKRSRRDGCSDIARDPFWKVKMLGSIPPE